MEIVKQHGRKPFYNFGNDPKLAAILKGRYSPKAKATKAQVTSALDSFLTIFLITLPEKFKQWYDYHNSGKEQVHGTDVKMVLEQNPMFPVFKNLKEWSRLSPHPLTGMWEYLPASWRLVECFDYYLNQNEMWTTPSIEAEIEEMEHRTSSDEVELFPTSDDDGEDSEEEDAEKGNTNEKEDEGQAAIGLESEIAEAIILNEPNKKENSGVAAKPVSKGKRKSSIAGSVARKRNPKKRKKSTNTEKRISKAEASTLIFDLSPTLKECSKSIDEMYDIVQDDEAAVNKLQEIQNKMEEIMKIESDLLYFAMDHQK